MLRRKHGYWSLLILASVAVWGLVVPARGEGYSSGVTAKVLQQTTVTSNGQPITYPRTNKAEVTALTVELAPGASTGWHKHPVPVYAYVVAGTLSVELEGGASMTYGANEAVIEVVDTWHNGRNQGPEPVKLAVFYLGSQGTPNVIKMEATPTSAQSPMEQAKGQRGQ